MINSKLTQNKITILSTRPIDDELINEAAKQNINIEVFSFIATEPIDDLDTYNEIEIALTETATIVFTSMNAVDAVASHLNEFGPDWKIYCIGNATRKLVAEHFGDNSITGMANDATELAQKIIDDDIDDVIFF
ncbi:MAG TPA: uroporphyrinogen-III synthase, partial [Parafilimonas sp.]|nr:uroporphyrinogen-III synthase [Parafilimonas sp.]